MDARLARNLLDRFFKSFPKPVFQANIDSTQFPPKVVVLSFHPSREPHLGTVGYLISKSGLEVQTTTSTFSILYYPMNTLMTKLVQGLGLDRVRKEGTHHSTMFLTPFFELCPTSNA